ncbi:hypothetical protein G9A89_015984 [Geosiphon pyriformis]|nr:hypothetical protein G9A89_015984 [Geosiphon pyriformis]
MSQHKGNIHDHNCSHSEQNLFVQTLEELDFTKSIHQACLQGDYDRVKSLIAKKGTRIVNESDKTGYKPLHYAARIGNEDICRLLLENRAEVNVVTPELFSTPLHRAAAENHSRVVKLLLKYGADPRVQDSDGQTPLHKACENVFQEVAIMLIENDKGLLRIKDGKGRLPIDCCKDEQLRNTLKR